MSDQEDVKVLPSADVKALMSLTAAGMLRLDRDVALNDDARSYWKLKRLLTILGLEHDPGAVKLLSLMESEAVALAMSRGDLETRMTSLADLSESPKDTMPKGFIPDGYRLVLVREDAGGESRTSEGLPPASDPSDTEAER